MDLKPDSKEVLEFIRCGRLFCELYDRVPTGEDLTWVREMHLALVDLYRAGLVLSAIPIDDTGEDPEITDEPVENILSIESKFGAPFGVRNFYAEAYDPEILNDLKNLVCGSIADDLHDIQHDIRLGLSRWNDAAEKERRHWIWHWRSTFQYHWSRHAVGAMRPMLLFIVEKDEGFWQ